MGRKTRNDLPISSSLPVVDGDVIADDVGLADDDAGGAVRRIPC
jgi:hypothetical protein